MSRFIVPLLLVIFSPIVSAQVPGDSSYSQHIFWAPGAAPSQGLAVAIQKEIFFGAYYGYEGGQPSFVTLIGSRDPSQGGAQSHFYSGDVFRTTSNGNSTDVGNFSWDGNYFCNNGQPCGELTMNSPVFSTNGTFFSRFSFHEAPDVGHMTGGVWWTGQDICISLPCPSFTHAIEFEAAVDNPAPSEFFDGEKVAVARRLNNGNNGDAIGVLATTTFDPTGRIEISSSDPFRLVFLGYPLLDGGLINGGSDIWMVCIGGNNQQFCNGWSLEPDDIPTGSNANFATIHAVDNQASAQTKRVSDSEHEHQITLDRLHLQMNRSNPRGSERKIDMLVSDQQLAKMYVEYLAISRRVQPRF